MKPIQLLILAFLLGAGTLSHAASNNGIDKKSDDDLTKFAKQIEASIQNDNPSYFTQCFDNDALVLKIVDKSDTADLDEFERGFRYGFGSGFDPGTNVLDEVGDKGKYTFLHSVKRGDQTTILFRIVTDDNIDYHEYMVENVDNEYKITDVLIYNSGLWLSQILKDFYQGFSTIIVPGGSDGSNFLTGMKNARKIQKLASRDKFGRAYKKFSELPWTLRSQYMFQVMGMRIASHLDSDICMSEYNQFVDNMPSHGGTYLIALQSFVVNQNQNMALKCVDSLDHYIEGDPFLNMLRANLYFQEKDFDQAEIRLRALIEDMPDYEEGYFSLLGLYLQTKDYSCATGLLDQMTENFNYYKEDVKTLLQEYPDFVASKEYQNWIAK